MVCRKFEIYIRGFKRQRYGFSCLYLFLFVSIRETVYLLYRNLFLGRGASKKECVVIGNDCDPVKAKKLEEETDEFPRLVIHFTGNKFTHAFVVADGVTIDTQANDIAFAVVVLLGCYYAFNLKYPTCWQNFIGLVQHIVVQEKFGNSSIVLSKELIL